MGLVSQRHGGGEEINEVHSQEPAYGPAQPPQRNTPQRTENVQQHPHRHVASLTDVELLHAGLVYAGFDTARQKRVNLHRNIERFKAFYGAPPTTVVPFFTDLKDAYPAIVYKNCLLTMNWVYLYESQIVLSGRWGYCEDFIGRKVIECGKKMQKLKEKKIVFQFNNDVFFG